MRKPHTTEQKSTSTSSTADSEPNLELLKAVAQAWHAQTGNPKPTNEFDPQRALSTSRLGPTRFKIEAVNNMMKQYSSLSSTATTTTWDFAESLLDSYEIVTLSKRLEASLAVNPTASAHESTPDGARARKRPRGESRSSLRSLFHKASSKRFDAVCGGGGDHHD